MIKSIADIKPTFDYVVITEFFAKSKNRILLPRTASAENQQFEVLAVGPGKANDDGTTRPMRLMVGDLVILPSCPSFAIYVVDDERKLGIVNEGNVVAVVGNVATAERGADPGKQRFDGEVAVTDKDLTTEN